MSASKAPSWLTKGFGNPGNAKKKAKADSGSMNAATSASHRPPEPVQKEGVEGIVDDEKSPEDLGCSGDDYMSDSLLPSHPEPRLQKKVEEELRSQPVSKKRALEEGLSQPIASDNLGFKMLSKMGYREGAGLGAGAGGMTSPLDVTLKSGRAGLGVDERRVRETRERAEVAVERRRDAERGVEEMRNTFVERQRAAFAAKQAAGDLTRAQSVCEQLDRRLGIEENSLWGRPEGPDGDRPKGEMRSFVSPNGDVYYTQVARRGEEANPEEEVMSGAQVVESFVALVRYLRERHVYCFGCSGKFATEEAFDGHCDDDDDCMSLLKASTPAANAEEIDISDV